MAEKYLKLRACNWGLVSSKCLALAKDLESRELIDFGQMMGLSLLKSMSANPHHTAFGEIVFLSAAFCNVVYRNCQDPTHPTPMELKQILKYIPEFKKAYRIESDGNENWTMTFKGPLQEMSANNWKEINWHFVFDVKGQLEYFPVAGSNFPFITELFQFLNGDFTKFEILNRFKNDGPLVDEFFEFAKTHDLLMDVSSSHNDHVHSLGIKFVSHSCLKFSSGDNSVVIDPAFLVAPPFQNYQGVFDHFTEELSKISSTAAIFITHHHWDHLNLQTLVRYPREIPIFIPEPSEETYFNPSIKNYLRSLGFNHIKTLSDWDEIQIKNLKLTAVPFRGEWFGPGSSFDAYCYLVEINGRKVLGTIDADRDERGDMIPVLEQLKERLGQIDILFFGSSGKLHQNPVFCGNPYLYSNTFKRKYQDQMRYHPDHETVLTWCQILRPRLVIPYAQFIFHNEKVRAPFAFNDLENFEGYFQDYWQRGINTNEPETLQWKHRLQKLKESLKEFQVDLLMLGPGEILFEA